MGTNNVVALVVFLAFGATCYFLGRAHQPRKPWEEGYQAGANDATKIVFRTAVRAAAANNTGNSRFRHLPWSGWTGRARGRARTPSGSRLQDETTIGIHTAAHRRDEPDEHPPA